MAPERPGRAELLSELMGMGRAFSTANALYVQAVADRLHMNATDILCLGILDWAGPVAAGRLAELTGLTTGAITGILDRLEQAGFVRRERDTRDRRRVIVQPLPARRERVRPLFAPMLAGMAEIYAAYSDTELALLLDYSRRIVAVLSAEAERLRAGDDAVAEPHA